MKGNNYIQPWTCLGIENGKVICYHIFCSTKSVADSCVRNCGKDTKNITVLSDEEAQKLYKQLHEVYGK